jgi:hypothetical protein
MPCGNFQLCHVSQYQTILTIIMDNGDQYIYILKHYVQKNAMC